MIGPANVRRQLFGVRGLVDEVQQVQHPLGKKAGLHVNEGKDLIIDAKMRHDEFIRRFRPHLPHGVQIIPHTEGEGEFRVMQGPPRHHGVA